MIPSARVRVPAPVPALVLTLTLVWGVGAPTHAQSGKSWAPDERILITSFDYLGAVAADMRRVYAASPNGIEIFDFAAQRWEPPITAEDGYPVGERPAAMAVTIGGGDLWLVTEQGWLHYWRPGFQRWDNRGFVGANPRSLHATDSGDLFLEAAGGWVRIRAIGVAEPVSVAEVPAAARTPARAQLERDPAFRSLAGTLGLDRTLRAFPMTDAARGDFQDRWWIATWGGNLLRYDGFRMQAEPLAFGALARGVLALARDGERVWFGGDGRWARNGVASADLDLQRWERWEAPHDGAPTTTNAILPTRDAVWFAAADGVYRYDRERRRFRRFTESDGVPDQHATSLAPADEGVWVGTARGLALVAGDAASRHAGVPPVRVHALALARDTLWVATSQALLAIPDRGLGAPEPRLAGDILDVLPTDDGVFALAPLGVYRSTGGAFEGPQRPPAQIGRATRLAGDADRLWLAAEAGAAVLHPATGVWQTVIIGPDIPEGPVTDVLPLDDHVWLATPAGALRLDWRD